jgi:signal transduction histidine kinase
VQPAAGRAGLAGHGLESLNNARKHAEAKQIRVN